MSNPFDQFDGKPSRSGANPFDEFDTEQPAKSEPATRAPLLSAGAMPGPGVLPALLSQPLPRTARAPRGGKPMAPVGSQRNPFPNRAPIGDNGRPVPVPDGAFYYGKGGNVERRDVGMLEALTGVLERTALNTAQSFESIPSALMALQGRNLSQGQWIGDQYEPASEIERQAGTALMGDGIVRSGQIDDRYNLIRPETAKTAERLEFERQLQADQSALGTLGALWDDKANAAGLLTESFGASAPAIAVSALTRNPYALMAINGASGYQQELSAGMVDYLEGMQIPREQWASLPEDVMLQAVDHAEKRALIVGGAGALSGRVAGSRLIGPTMTASPAKAVVGNVVGQSLLGATIDGVGEDLAQRAGNLPYSPQSTVLETAGGALTQPVEALQTSLEAAQLAGKSWTDVATDADLLAVSTASNVGRERQLEAALALMNRGQSITPEGTLGGEPTAVRPQIQADPEMPDEELAATLGQIVEQNAEQQAQEQAAAPILKAVAEAVQQPVARPEPVQAPRAAATAPEEKGLGDIVGVPADDQWDILRQFFDQPELVRQAGTEADLSPATATPPVGQTNDRRQDPMRRKAIAEMSPDELRSELMTSPVTGGRNRRAYQDAPKKPVQVALDADNLKWVNDNMGHQNGDSMIAAIHEALSAETDDAYHISGDEFVIQADSQDQADAIMARVQDRLSRVTITATLPDGRVLTKTGIGVSYGAGQNLEAAESALGASKTQRAAEGRRFNRDAGGTPEGVAVAPAEGNQAQGDAAPAVEQNTPEVEPADAQNSEQEPSAQSAQVSASDTPKSIVSEGRLLSLLDAAKANGIDLTALQNAYSAKDGGGIESAINDILAQMRPEPMRSTGLKNAVTDAEREAANKDPILREAVKGNEATLYEAIRTLKSDPLAGPEAISRLNRAGTEGISLADEAVLLVYKTELMNKRDSAAKKLADANASEDAKESARKVWEESEAAISAIDLASVNAGREWGRFGQFRQRMLKADFTFEAMERKERARLERPLNAEESARIKEMAEKIAALQARVDQLQRRKKNASSESAYEALERALSRPKKERKSLEYLKKAANDARARIAAAESVPSRRGQSGAVMSPAILYDYAILGAYHIANGAAEFADWVSAMRADLGEKFDKFRDRHQEIFGASKKLRETPIKADASVTEVMEGIDLANIKPKDVRKLIEALIGEGLRGEQAVIGAASEKLELSEDDVRALFIQTEPRGPQTLTEAQEELRDLKKIVRLEAEIDRLEAGKPKPSRGEPAVDSPEVAAKKQELADLRRHLRPVIDPEQRYQELRGKQIQKRIEDLQARIARGDFAARPRIPRALNEANERALFELDKAKEEFLRYQYLEELKNRSKWGKAMGFTANAFNLSRAIMTSIDLSGLLRQGGFITFGRPKMAIRDFIQTLPALLSDESKYRVMNEIKSRPNAPLYLKYKLALTEIGAGPLTRVEEAFASAWIEKLERVKGQPIRNAARTAANLALAPVRGSGRVYTAFLNKLRADAFDALAATMTKTGTPTEAEAKWIVDFVNTATGRAKIWGRTDNPGEIINALAFAPRLVVSRLSLATATPIWTAPSGRARKLAAMEYARFLTGVAVVSSLLAYSLGDDEDDQEYEDYFTFDPRSADFMKLRFGNTRLDPFTGISQVTVMMSRLLTGETVNAKGEVRPIRPKWTLTDFRRMLGEDIPAHEGITDEGKLNFGERTSMDVIASFLRSKLAPIPGAAVNIIAGSDFKGDPITLADQTKSLLLPMSFGDIADAMEENGVPRGTAMSMLALLGMSMQVQTPSNRQQFAQFTDEVDAVRADVKERLNQLPIEEWPAKMDEMKSEYGPMLEGVELDYYKQDGKYGYAGEPKRDKDGNPVLKSSRLSEREKYDDGLPGTQVHHIIPDNLVRRHPLMAAARKAGYDLDSQSNLISMPDKAKDGEVAHTTDHPNYDAEVYGALQEATKRLRKEHGSLDEAPAGALLEEVRKVEEAMRERLMKKDVPTKDGRLARVGGASQMGA